VHIRGLNRVVNRNLCGHGHVGEGADVSGVGCVWCVVCEWGWCATAMTVNHARWCWF
jgi:hypothetical protein